MPDVPTVQINVRNFFGALDVSAAAAPTAILAGGNGAGKSSVLYAAAAALSGKVLPVPGMLKKDAGDLVYDGEKEAAVVVGFDRENYAKVTWPDAERFTVGEPPRASEHSAFGLLETPGEHMLDWPVEKRAEFLTKVLKAAPTKDDLARDMANLPYVAGDADASAAKATEAVETMWGMIEADSWDGVLAVLKNRSTEKKTLWGEAAGERWGVKKAESWLPEGYELADLERIGDDIEKDIAEAKDAVEALIGAEAVDAARLEAATAEAASLDDLRSALQLQRDRKAAAEENIAALEAEQEKIGPRSHESGFPCPHCGEKFALVKQSGATTKIEKAVETPDAEIKKNIKSYSGFSKKIADERSILLDAETQEKDISAAVETGEKAERLLESAQSSGEDGAAKLQEARDLQAQLTALRDAAVRHTGAYQLHAAIKLNLTLQEIIAPEGLRRKILTRALAAFNESRIKPLTEDAEMAPIQIDGKLNVVYGTRTYAMRSFSEKRLVKAILSLALAPLLGDSIVLVDGGDYFDADGRIALLRAHRASGVALLVAMTGEEGDIKSIPALDRNGLGHTYWLEPGHPSRTFKRPEKDKAA